MGDKYAGHEYMAEDFLSIGDDEDDLCFDPNSMSTSNISIPTHHQHDLTLQALGEVQLHQSQLKSKIFEATESTILHNKRAHIKKIKRRNYSTGQNVLFRNPKSTGLVSALNVRGTITGKIGIDLYRVQYADETIILFGCQMVGVEKAIDDHDKQLQENKEQLSDNNVGVYDILEKIYETADNQRNYLVAKRKYNLTEESVVDDIVKNVGIEKSDFPAIYYCALDCALMASITHDDNWQLLLIEYHEALLAYLQLNRFQYHLSGVYLWEMFRAQTVSHCTLDHIIPMFHYCCNCLDSGLCTHSCCRIWLQNVCKKVGLTCASSSHGSESESPASTFNNLTLLAAVASKELEREKTKLVKVAQKASYRSMSLKKLKLDHSSNKQSSKAEKDDIRHKLYIERNLPSLTVSRGRFTERMETLKGRTVHLLQEWVHLTPAERNNFYQNVRYAVTVINREAASHQIKTAGTLPFMQLQGASNYCGVCALNNLLGKDVISVRCMNEAADDLWLRQVDELGQPLTENLQCHRDINGFFSWHTMEAVLERFGHCLHLLSAHESLSAMLSCKQSSGVMQELARQYGIPLKLLILDRESEHYTVVHIDSNAIWYFDSKKRTPTTLTIEEFVTELQHVYEATYCVQPQQTEV